MHKSKKNSSKSDKIPKPIKIKKEKTEEDRSLHPMSHYIDDRLELVKQIFGSLKPKTITNLSPEFLKQKSMEEVEELCLNELLCISTKRLLSIINATKCPTDTESDNDSDVEQQEEHVSLEEISSDSEIEGSAAGAAKKKSGTSVTGNGAKKDTKNSNEKNQNDGQISVLELLELQARARAIRSQLALEPVTKIEVDSDEEQKANKAEVSNGKKSSKERKHSHKHKASEKEQRSTAKPHVPSSTVSSSAAKQSKSNGGSNEPTSTAPPDKESEKRLTKRIKLKRNYRSSNTNQEEKNESEKRAEEESKITSTESSAQTSKDMKKERSQSPDVIQIVAETVTLLISDSSDAEDKAKSFKNVPKNVAGEKKEIEKEIKMNVSEENVNTRERKITEPEEGEIRESDVGMSAAVTNSFESNSNAKSDEATTATSEKDIKLSEKPLEVTENKKTVEESQDKTLQINQEESDSYESTSSESETEKTNEKRKFVENEENKGIKQEDVNRKVESSNVQLPTNDVKAENSSTGTNLEEYDDQNDDVISIEGGDIESEMIEHLEDDSNTKSSFSATAVKLVNEKEKDDADIISLDSSDDEQDAKTSESWRSRYVKSSKVSKVLAASRLSKRVRDKIRKSKHAKKDLAVVKAEAEQAEKVANIYTSKHEDGSIEQYKELLEMRQRKNS